MAEDKKKEIDVTVIEVTEEYLKEKLYKIRGKRVLLQQVIHIYPIILFLDMSTTTSSIPTLTGISRFNSFSNTFSAFGVNTKWSKNCVKSRISRYRCDIATHNSRLLFQFPREVLSLPHHQQAQEN